MAFILGEDGFSVPEIFKRIGTIYGPAPAPIKSNWCDPLDSYLAHHLKRHDEGYVKLGANLFNAALGLARLWAELNAQHVASSTWPPPDMFGKKEKKCLKALDCFKDDEIGRGVRRFKVRAIPGDKVLNYATDSISWIAKMGSMGFALVRDGQSIDFIETIRN